MLSLRNLLVLGRTSNLPTVWSNCLAGWILGGGGDWKKFALLVVGSTLLYLAGMFLNDAFDARFDSEHRPQRPIPSGAVSVGTVFKVGFFLLFGGVALFFLIGKTVGWIGLALAACIVLYDAVHKVITLSPVLMALCRWLLYISAGAATEEGLSGWPIWCGLALALYVVGLSFLAKKESTGVKISYWPCLLLLAPVGLALFMDSGANHRGAIMLSVALILWIVKSLRYVWQKSEMNVGRAVSGLLAGIVLVDMLALVDMNRQMAAIFLALLFLAAYFQRYVPAT